MKHIKNIMLLFMVLLTMNSCSGQGDKAMKKQSDFERHFTIEDTSDIGVLRIKLTKDIILYEKPNDSSQFASITMDGKRFSPKELEHFFNPLYFDFSGDYGEESNYHTYIIRDWTFRVLSKDDDWIKIVFDEKGHRTCYLKTEKTNSLYFFQTWENYFKGESFPAYSEKGKRTGSYDFIRLFITIDDQKLYDTINGNVIERDKDFVPYFFAGKIQGDWMQLEKYRDSDKEAGYWVKWRDGSKILIDYSETWGLE